MERTPGTEAKGITHKDFLRWVRSSHCPGTLTVAPIPCSKHLKMATRPDNPATHGSLSPNKGTRGRNRECREGFPGAHQDKRKGLAAATAALLSPKQTRSPKRL